MKNTKILKLILVALVIFAVNAAEAQARLRSSGSSRRNSSAAATPSANATASAAAVDGEEASASDLNFKDAPVEMIFEIYGKLVDRTVLKDPQTPQATITLESRPGQKLTKEEQIEAIEVVCEMNGIHFENYGDKFVRALPRKGAEKEGIPLYMDPSDEDLAALPMGKVVAVMLEFKNISVQDEAQKALEGFKTASGLLQVFERTNSILVTDTKQNILVMMKIARAIDIASPVLESVFVRQIEYASASEIKTALEQIVQESQKELEKSGKAQQNAQANAASRNRPEPTVLKRPGTNNNPPAAPTSLESLVTSVSDADRGLIRGKVLILADERSNKLIVITAKANMDFFDKVIKQLDVETTPDTVVKVYRLKYAEAEDVSDMINDLIGNSSKSSNQSRENQNANAKAGSGANLTSRSGGTNQTTRSPANQRTGEPKAGELSKDNTTVLADKRINGLVVMTQRELVPTVESIIESMDVRLSQVLIETVVIEVTLGDELQTGIDWMQRGKTGGKVGTRTVTSTSTDADGNTTSSSSEVPVYGTLRDADASFFNRSNYMLGGGGGKSDAASLLQNLVTSNATAVLSGLTGGGINYFLKSDKLNLAAIIQASKNDSRAKYIASPILMTVDNQESIIEATQSQQFLTGWTAQSSSVNGAGMPSPNYSAKDIGITVKVTPKINPNGTVMLKVDETYSQVAKNAQTMKTPVGSTYRDDYIDVAVSRNMQADVILENGQTVVLGGLTQTETSESESGIPILKDIPWIGKWLFGSVSQTENRKELLVFMTPYVLDDAEAAQAEAFRRKKALSDAAPWTDNGWSASKLADPIGKKEQMRRLKDEWKRQDEERKTRLAVEKAKMDRAKALEQMDEEERKFWIETHREELEKEEKERFDEFMKEQSDLKALAEDIKTSRMKKAEEAIKEADEAMRKENEAGRLEKEAAESGASDQGSGSGSLLNDLGLEE